MAILESLNLSLRFLLELAALGAVAWWGHRTGGVPLAVAAPLVLAVLWGALLSPNAPVDMPGAATIALQLAVLAAAAGALAAVQRPALAVAMTVTAVANGALMAVLGQ